METEPVMSILSKAYFHNEEAAIEHVEAVLWPDGPTCPHCGACDRIGKIQANVEKRVRLGLHKCGHCKGQFTVKVGTVFEASKVPLCKWLQAVFTNCSCWRPTPSLPRPGLQAVRSAPGKAYHSIPLRLLLVCPPRFFQSA